MRIYEVRISHAALQDMASLQRFLDEMLSEKNEDIYTDYGIPMMPLMKSMARLFSRPLKVFCSCLARLL